MSKKDLLKQKAKPKLATSAAVIPLPVKAQKHGELDHITREIRSNLDELRDIQMWWQEKKIRVSELRESIIDRLVYVRDHRKKLLPNRTFEDYLTNDIGISKGYFYEQIQAYNVCMEYKRPELYKDVDPKVLVNIAREKDPERQKELIEKAPSLSREYFKKVRPSDFSEKARGADPASDPAMAIISRNDLTIRVSDAKVLRQIEELLKAKGITFEYA